MTMTPDRLSDRSRALFEGSGLAIDWVRDVRRNARRLDRDADGLIEKLRRTRNQCRRLGSAALRPLSVGVFGMSQAGKSYLISTLARSANGQLETVLDGHHLNFIGHINPPGGGKEATGLVTRFTRQPAEAPRGYPVELTLFSEGDLVKILGNSFFNDFDPQRVSFKTDAEHVRQHLALFEKQRQPQPTGGLDEDAMVDLMDYFEKRFANSMEPLKADFWPAVVDLAPRLPSAQRGRLLSLLWGEIADFTAIYVRLRDALAALSQARTVYVPLEALVVAKGSGFDWNEDSIINVDVLNRLGKDETAPLTVLPVVDGEVRSETGISRSLLTALTAEMKFVLADPPVATMLESVDLLDFPGYRGRLSVTSLDEVRKEVKRDDVDPVAQLLLRGKVAYLFERYTDDQEMNVLIMCTRCDQQIEITALAPVLSTWVQSTQGKTPADRTRHRPGLVWVLTQLDRKLEPKPGQTETQERQEWTNMIHITLLERFSQCEWLHEWSDGRPFDNVFLVRKPGFLRSVFETEGESLERGFLPGQEERLARLRTMFVEDENVRRYVNAPEQAWDSVLRLNDGGMERLAHYLAQVAMKETKLLRIGEQIDQLTDDIVQRRLGPYFFAEGAGEVEKKQKIAAEVWTAIEERADAFGELLFSLQPSSEQLRRLYLRAETAADGEGEAAEAEATDLRARRPGLVRLPLAKKTATDAAARPTVSGRTWLFAKAVLSAWIKQLRNLPDDLDLQRHLGLPPALLQMLTDEMISGADRVRVEDQLIQALQPLEEKRSTTRIRIVDQQVLLARMVVDDFVDGLGFVGLPPADRPASPVDGRKIFEPPPPIPAGSLPRLPAEEIQYSGMFIVDWLEAFRHLAIANAGHNAGREISPEQNQRLGGIIAAMRGEAPATA
jgi:hypothetical protein